jgi:hypothetical protein
MEGKVIKTVLITIFLLVQVVLIPDDFPAAEALLRKQDIFGQITGGEITKTVKDGKEIQTLVVRGSFVFSGEPGKIMETYTITLVGGEKPPRPW